MKPSNESPSPRASGGAGDGAQAIHRAAAILRAVASQGPRGIQMVDVARVCGLNKGTAHRILLALNEERLVERVPDSRKFRLGVDILSLAASMSERLDLKSLARPSLERLAARTEDAVYLGIRSGYDGLCLDSVIGSFPDNTLTLSVGDRWPLGVGSFSMALLAWLPDEEVAEIIRTNEKRLAGQDLYSPAVLHAKVLEARKLQYAYREVRIYPGMSGVGVPILDQQGRPIASLCVAAQVSRMSLERRREVVRLAREEAERIAAAYLAPPADRVGMDSWRTIGRGDTPRFQGVRRLTS